MEQGHGRVPDVVRADAEHRGHPLARRQQPALRAAHRLGRGGRARREQQRPQDLGLTLRPTRTFGAVAGSVTLPGDVERMVQRLTHRHGRIIGVGKALRDEDAARQVQPINGGLEQCLVARLSDQELYIGVRDVAGQVLVAPCVVQPDQRRSHKPRTAQREHIVRGVVQEHGDMGRSIGIEPGAVQRGESLGFEKKLSVSPHLVAEAKRRAAGVARVEAVASQKGGDVPGGEGHLAEGRGEHRRVRPPQRLPRARGRGARSFPSLQAQPRRASPSLLLPA